MTRKITVNAGDSIGSLFSKNNQMSNYLGDLDSLDPHFALTQFVDDPDVGRYDDSSFVKAINHLHYELDSINSFLTGGTASLTINNLIADSGRFTNISVGSITIDSATIDSSFVNLLRGNTLDYNSATFDSARITNLSGHLINYDSARFKTLRSDKTFGDSARITSISGSGTLNYATGQFTTMDADSIGFTNASVVNFNANSITVNNTVTFDERDMIDAKLFTIKDSTGANLIAGYLLSTSETLGIA